MSSSSAWIPTRGTSPVGDRVGPFYVVREVSRALGTSFYEATDHVGARRLLQVTGLRSTASESERAERRAAEQAIAEETVALVATSAFEIHAHGGVEAEDGGRLLFWALPWSAVSATALLTRAQGLSHLALLDVGAEVARALEERHLHGWFAPFLSEHSVSRGVDGRVEILGVPVLTPPRWIDEQHRPTRLAPEERLSGRVSEAGDVFRLGALLLELADLTKLPESIRELLDRLVHADPSARPVAAVARQLLAALAHEFDEVNRSHGAPSFVPARGARGAIDGGAVESSIERSSRSAAGGPKEGPEEAGGPGPGGAGTVTGTGTVSASVPASVPVTVPVDDVEVSAETTLPLSVDAPHGAGGGVTRASASEAVTAEERPEAVDRDLEEDLDREAFDRRPTDTMRRVRTSPAPSSVAPSSVAPSSVAPSSVAPSSVVPSSVAPSSLAPSNSAQSPPSATGLESHTEKTAPVSAEIAPREEDREGGREGDREQAWDPESGPALDVFAAFWAQPVLPAGESPWSEVVHARGAHRRERGEFSGLTGDVPVVCPRPSPNPERRSAWVRTVSSEDRPLGADAPGNLEAEIAAALSGRPTGRIIAGILTILVVCGVMALWARSGEKSEEPTRLKVSSTHEVVLTADPADTQVVSESDGRVLGRTPLTFMVGPGQRISVLLVARGYEPIRLELPNRGRLTVSLNPTSTGSSCEVEISSPEASALAGVEADIGSGPLHTIPGAAVVRPAVGWARGARLVHCADLRGGAPSKVRLHFDDRPRMATVRIAEPVGAEAYLDDRLVGTIPTLARTQQSAVRLRVVSSRGASRERWLVVDDHLEVHLEVRFAEAEDTDTVDRPLRTSPLEEPPPLLDPPGGRPREERRGGPLLGRVIDGRRPATE